MKLILAIRKTKNQVNDYAIVTYPNVGDIQHFAQTTLHANLKEVDEGLFADEAYERLADYIYETQEFYYGEELSFLEMCLDGGM
jgi:hypothetical protein